MVNLLGNLQNSENSRRLWLLPGSARGFSRKTPGKSREWGPVGSHFQTQHRRALIRMRDVSKQVWTCVFTFPCFYSQPKKRTQAHAPQTHRCAWRASTNWWSLKEPLFEGASFKTQVDRLPTPTRTCKWPALWHMHLQMGFANTELWLALDWLPKAEGVASGHCTGQSIFLSKKSLLCAISPFRSTPFKAPWRTHFCGHLCGYTPPARFD